MTKRRQVAALQGTPKLGGPFRAQRLDQYFRNFGTSELHRRHFTSSEHLSHFCAGQRHMIGRRVWASLARRHSPAGPAIESVVKKEWRDPQLLRFELVEDLMCVISSVVIPDTGVISSDDEMRATVVLTYQRMKDRFTWTGVPHRCWHDRQNGSCRWVIAGEYRLV